MSYADEIERVAEDCRRRSALLLDELEEVNRRTATISRALAEKSIAGMRQFCEEHAEEFEKARAAVAEKERLETEAREQREAIARSIAARRANEVFVPVDDEDEEAAYYQRKSWLI